MTATHVLIMAAGKSRRFRTTSSKVLYPICGRPAIQYLLQSVRALKSKTTVLVISPQYRADFATACAEFKCSYALQKEAKGSGDAVKIGLRKLPKTGRLLILSGDAPLLTTATLQRLLTVTAERHAVAGLISMILPDGKSYGRVVTNDFGDALKIVEAKECTPSERSICEVNAGIYAVDLAWLHKAIPRLKKNNAQGEYYLTDIVTLAQEDGKRFAVMPVEDPQELLGMNTRVEAAQVAAVQRQRINERHMDAGVDIVDPQTTYIDDMVKIGAGTRIFPGVCVMGETHIGSDVTLNPYSVIQNATVGNHSVVGPFGRLRPGAELAEGVHVGNFVEIKKSNLAKGVKVNHLTYIGDADIGSGTNVGCGTITCNYDGVKKHRTVIGKNVFVGSDVAFVAPVTIGDGATIGAGSVITERVPPQTLALARGRQVNIKNWKK